jgi:hypothetical protein
MSAAVFAKPDRAHSIRRDRRIDIVVPGLNPTFEVAGLRITGVDQKPNRACRSSAGSAVDNYLVGAEPLQLAQPGIELSQWNVEASDLRNLALVRFAYIQ